MFLVIGVEPLLADFGNVEKCPVLSSLCHALRVRAW